MATKEEVEKLQEAASALSERLMSLEAETAARLDEDALDGVFERWVRGFRT